MTYQLEIKAEAKSEIIEAAKWYATKVTGFDQRFIDQLEIIVNTILTNQKTSEKIYKHYR
jgi:hypothetical protein